MPAQPVVGRIVLGTDTQGRTYAAGLGVSLEDLKHSGMQIAAAIADTPLGGDLAQSVRLSDDQIGPTPPEDVYRFLQVTKRKADQLEETYTELLLESGGYDEVNQRHLSLARDHFETALMFLKRALHGIKVEEPAMIGANGQLTEYGRKHATITSAMICDAKIADPVSQISDRQIDVDDCK
jgi:hypothetical protein